MHNTTVGVDLAKQEIQVCVSKRHKVQSNQAMTPELFTSWLVNSSPMTIVFEACSTSNYWKQQALKYGHDARLISAKLVASVRQNQKTDKNDALAVLQASQLTGITFINGKSREQQELQSLARLRDCAVKHKVAQGNQLAALLLEFNIRVSANKSDLGRVIQSLLEDAENGFSFPFRKALQVGWQQYLSSIDSIKKYDACIEKSVNQHEVCRNLQALEGVGPLNAINLFVSLGCGEMGVFSRGRDAAACIGVTPVQHSSGGKVKLGSVGKYVKNSHVRSCLVSGAMAAVHHATKRQAKTKKDLWIQQLVERRGKRCAAVALANKTVRTAFAMLANGTKYKAELLPA